jgi:ABC-type uncharacterized transport system substrate-binding protein
LGRQQLVGQVDSPFDQTNRSQATSIISIKNVETHIAPLMRKLYQSSSAPSFDLVVNLQTAKALGRNIPESLLQRADQMIDDRVSGYFL